MDTNEQKQPTISDLWDKLLQPSPTMGTRGRYHKCERDWYGMDDAQRLWVYHHLDKLRAKGEINPNPCFALNDAMQHYEQEQYKLQRAQKKREPENLNHKAIGRTMMDNGTAEIAFYGTSWGVYSKEDIKTFNLLTKKEDERRKASKK